MLRKPILAAGVAALLLAPALAAAEPFWLHDGDAAAPSPLGQFYIAPRIAGGVQHMPRFNSTVSTFTSVVTPPFAFTGPSPFHPEPSGVEPGGAIGFMFRDGTFPATLGQRVRIELGGEVLASSSTTDRGAAPLVTFGGFFVSGISGTTFFNGSSGVASFHDSLQFHRDGFRLALKAASDYALRSDLSFTPSLAVRGGWTSNSYVYSYGLISGPSEIPGGVNERVRTSEVGLDLGGALSWQFSPGFALNVGGTVGFVWMHSRLTGDDYFGSGAGQRSSVAASAATVGFRGTAKLTLAADLGLGTAILGGFMRYDSQIPGVDNPQITVLDQAAGTNPAARVRFAGGIAYGGYLSLHIPLFFF